MGKGHFLTLPVANKGEDNIISFAVHCDETSIHAHVQTIPVEKVRNVTTV